MKKLTFVTQNQNKLADAQRLLPEFEIEHVDFDVPEIQSLDSEEIIKQKLEYAYAKIQKPCFVMDASLALDCLNGFPGPFIKWWFEKTVGEEKTCAIAALFGERGITWTNVLGYFDGTDTHYLQETIKGALPEKPRGKDGYHWDTIFIPAGETETFAEMGFERKQTIAPTKKLLRRLAEIVK
ncbi:MAG: Non-canonical purine NTP pyrophosphatase [Candidatus Magasanikbacteria bacterium GW2011_GWA2_43_9]|nr:MAG: Non-canonical purine NTP pyrophosphatase [Candidatus Magasanikbacteria bacterium GW2011_GWA2_43_9]